MCGGSGGSGGGSGGGGSGPDVMTYEQFAAKSGAPGMLEEHGALRFPHGITERQQKKLRKANAAKLEAGITESKATREAYNQAIKSGQIRPPSRIESLMATAKGHSDNPSVQAARRILKKQGLSW